MSWITICENLKTLPTETVDKPVTYRITQVPNTAKEILVRLWIVTGGGNGDSGRTFEVVSQTERGMSVGVCFFAYGYSQDGRFYNSENVWLPMPFDNEVTVKLYGEKFEGWVQSGIEIRGYKS